MVIGKIDGIILSLLNVYIPPGSNWSLYKQILELASTRSQGILLCGGDLNLTLNAELDSSNGKGDARNIGKRMVHLMDELGLVDVWRDCHSTDREYTHYSCAHNVYSRLDYIFMFKNDLCRLKNCEIGPCTISDHNPVYANICLNRKNRSTLWRLNTNILNYPDIKERLKKEIEEYLEYNDKEEVSPGILWDALKAVIRGKIIGMSSYLKKVGQQKLRDLEKKLLDLQYQHSRSCNGNIKADIIKLKKEMDDLNTMEVQKKLMFIKQQYYEVGGKSLKLLSYKLRKQQAERTIHKIKNPLNDQIEIEQGKIQQCFLDYYKTLYSQPHTDNNQDINTFLSELELPTVTEEQNKKLLSTITKEEIQLAIQRLKGGKMAGADGFGPEWYKIMQVFLVPILQKTFNWVMAYKIVPPSWREAIISIIPKEGKDRLQCSSYRPISVLNIDYKLFTSIMSRRLETILPGLIHKDQTGFIKHRQTQDNIRRVLHILRQVDKQKLETLVLSLDAEKAFDSVKWFFLYKVLEKFGFDKSVIEVISGLYNNPTARIKINGDLTESFVLERGTRQGCCISPLLFALFIEPLSQWIRQRKDITGIGTVGGEQKLALFADDLLLTISYPTQVIPKIIKLLLNYGSFSGYKVNVDKTQVLTLNYTPPEEVKNSYKWKGGAESIRYLGVVLHRDFSKMFEANYGPLNKAIKSDIQRWNNIPFLDLHSRIDSIRVNVLPRLLYLFQCLPIFIPQKQFVEWDRMLSKYIWKGKKSRVKYKTLQLKKDKGGHGLPCLQAYYCAAQLRPLICLCSSYYTAGWKVVEGTNIKAIPVQALLADIKLQNKIRLVDEPISHVMIAAWNEAIETCGLEDTSKILKWCAYDSDFTPNQYDDRFKNWILKGLTDYYSFVHKGAIQSFESLQRKHGLGSADFFRYLQIRHYFNQKLKVNLNNLGFVGTFISLTTNSGAHNKIISRLYNSILRCKKDNTLYVKTRWEKEGNLRITEECWEHICKIQWVSTGSNVWREFCWKSIMRFFITPVQKRYRGNGDACWRCGGCGANHYHIFWDC
uniref:Reverse transcriptase domain-containing protein n=1 Tax=Sander lucioperca TaxID=283035 RepID=A0A8C9XT72_SANLU